MYVHINIYIYIHISFRTMLADFFATTIAAPATALIMFADLSLCVCV